jgi:hypothetical protein
LKGKKKGKKGIVAYNKLFEKSSMKQHVESKHSKLLATYIWRHDARGTSRMQGRNDGGGKGMLPTKKQLEVARGANFSFFGSDTHYKK